jgi:hypothetical protein
VLFIAALIMGVAVNGMHFTGMYAMRVSELQDKPVAGFMPSRVPGADPRSSSSWSSSCCSRL